MPGLYAPSMSRKQFLTATGAMAAGLLATAQNQAAENDNTSAHLALLSDTHIPADPTNGYRGFSPIANLQQVIPQAVATGPQAAILNGDAARLVGAKEDYTVLKTLLKPLAELAPVHIGLGNHDHRENFFEVFPGDTTVASPVSGKHVSTFEMGGTRFVILDSLLYVNKVAGLLGKGQRNWLAKFLDEADESPIVFFVHHTLNDGDGDLLDFDRVFEIMKPHRKVKAIFYGHSHRYHVEQREHIYLINQPAIGYNFNDTEPVGWLDAQFTPRQVELTLHAVGGNASNNGQTKTIAWS